LRDWIEAGVALGSFIITTAATIGYLRARDHAYKERFESLEARVLILESPAETITRTEFEARHFQLFQNIGWLAEEVLRSRRRG